MPVAILYPNGSVQNEWTNEQFFFTDTWASIDEGVLTPNDADFVIAPFPNEATFINFAVSLTDTPSDYESLNNLSVRMRYKQSTTGDDTTGINARITSSSGTVLTNELELLPFQISHPTTFTNITQALTLNAAGLAATKTDWNGAILQLRNRHSASMSSDGRQFSVSALEVLFDYTVQTAPTVAPSGVSATALGTGQVTTSWTALSGATSYELERDGVAIANQFNPISSNFNGLKHNQATNSPLTAWRGRDSGATTSDPVATTTPAEIIAGSGSMKITKDATAVAGDWDPIQTEINVLSVVVGKQYTCRGEFRLPDGARNMRLILEFFDSGGTLISGSEIVGTSTSVATTGSTVVSVTGTAPTNAVSVRVMIRITNINANARIICDSFSFHEGTSISYLIPVNPVIVTGTSYTDVGLTGGTTYAYTVRATNSAGSGPYSSAVNATTGPKNMLAKYEFAETSGTSIADTAVNTSGLPPRTATLTPGTASTLDAEGYKGSGVLLDGTGRVTTLGIPVLGPHRTYIVSFKADAIMHGAGSTTHRMILRHIGSGGSTHSTDLRMNMTDYGTDALEFKPTDSGDWPANSVNITGPADLAWYGVWHRVAITQHGYTTKMYMDGVLATTRTTASIYAPLSNTVTLGANEAGESGFIGTIDEAVIYNYALTQAEVESDYNSFLGIVVDAAAGATANAPIPTITTPVYFVPVAGGGNWTTGATWNTGTVPTANDHVEFRSTSGNVVINAASVCASLVCIDYTGTITRTSTLAIGSATVIRDDLKALEYSSGMTLSDTASISLVSTSGAEQTIKTNGVDPGILIINGVGGYWKLLDTFTSSAITSFISVLGGTFNTNNFNITIPLLQTFGSLARRLILGSSQITLGKAFGSALTLLTTNLTMDTNTAQFFITGASGPETSVDVGFNTNGSSVTYNNIATSARLGGGIWNNISFTSTTVVDSILNINSDIVCTNLTIIGKSQGHRILVQTYLLAATKTITATNIDINNVDFNLITAGGGGWNVSDRQVGDGGSNTNITFPAGVAQTWSGSSGGNWSDNAWTTRIPLPQDDVTIGPLGAVSITLDTLYLGNNISVADAGPTFNQVGLTINRIKGSLLFRATCNASFNFFGSGTINTTAVNKIEIRGTYILASNLIATGTGYSCYISGVLDTKNYSITVSSMQIQSGQIIAGRSNITTTASSGTVWNVFSAQTQYLDRSHITLGTGTKTFEGGGKAYGSLNLAGNGGTTTITGSNSFEYFHSKTTTAVRNIVFSAGATNSFRKFDVFSFGTTDRTIIRAPSTTKTFLTLLDTSIPFDANFVTFTYADNTSGVTANIGTGSTVSNSLNWSLTDDPALIFPAWESVAVGGMPAPEVSFPISAGEKPTLLDPLNNTSHSLNDGYIFIWQHNDANGDTQTGYSFRRKPVF